MKDLLSDPRDFYWSCDWPLLSCSDWLALVIIFNQRFDLTSTMLVYQIVHYFNWKVRTVAIDKRNRKWIIVFSTFEFDLPTNSNSLTLFPTAYISLQSDSNGRDDSLSQYFLVAFGYKIQPYEFWWRHNPNILRLRESASII